MPGTYNVKAIWKAGRCPEMEIYRTSYSFRYKTTLFWMIFAVSSADLPSNPPLIKQRLELYGRK